MLLSVVEDKLRHSTAMTPTAMISCQVVNANKVLPMTDSKASATSPVDIYSSTSASLFPHTLAATRVHPLDADMHRNLQRRNVASV